MSEPSSKKLKKILKGVVVSDAMDKTVVVRVTRFVKHPKYGKYMRKSKKYKAHDEQERFTVGDVVYIEESKPFSKEKTFRVIEKISSSNV